MLTSAQPAPGHTRQAMIDEILDQLEPLITLQRRAIARQGCLRAVSSTQLHVLFLLSCNGALPMSRLAELMDVSLPNATGIVERMVEHGLAERTRDDQDRRLVLVSATDTGQATVEEIDLVRRKRLADVLGHMRRDQLERALDTFRDLRAAIEASELELPSA
jgi:DNA-binding MarR family transcriptional regulator